MSRGEWVALAAVVILAVGVRIANFDRTRIHTDEFITSFFSATHDFTHGSVFATMPNDDQWDARFPTPYFFFQRIFFHLFGPSLLTIRLSVQIYVAIATAFLFLITRELLDTRAAVAAGVLSSFFAISVYLETHGFMFISSTAALTFFFWSALREMRTEAIADAGRTGIATGLCYLTYYSSYLAFPILLAFVALRTVRRRSWVPIQNFAIAAGGALIVLAPFLTAAIRWGGGMGRRSSEISLLHGEWSSQREAIAQGASPVRVVAQNFWLALRAMAIDDLGGQGGYDFGRRAMFETFGLLLAAAGIVCILVLVRKKPELLLVLVAAGGAFVGGTVLTIPPPAYHRMSVAFPFLAIVMAVPFSVIGRVERLPRVISDAVAAGLLLLFACRNEDHLSQAALRDIPRPELEIARLINQRFPKRPFYVAAFPGYGFDRIFYFAGPGSHDRPRVETEYHANMLPHLNPGEKYVYMMIFTDDFKDQFHEKDPNGKLYPLRNGISLFAN